MEYMKLIEKRKSSRRFKEKEIPLEKIDELKQFFNEMAILDGCELRAEVYTDNTVTELEGIAGYSGFALGAPAYIFIYGMPSDKNYIAAGYTAMDIDLKLTEMGLDSCFITITDSDSVKNILDLNCCCNVLTCIAAGYEEPDETDIRIDIKSPSNVTLIKRKDHQAPKISRSDMVFEDKWGQAMDFHPDRPLPFIADAFYAASLAPSFFNRQLYRYIYNGDTVIAATRRDNLTSHEDALISLGCSMFCFSSVYEEQCGSPSQWKLEEADANIPDDFRVFAIINI